MFSNDSSSDEISTESSDAFVQNRKEPAEHKAVCGTVEMAISMGHQLPSACLVDQVPVLRDTTGDRASRSGGSSSVSAAAAGKEGGRISVDLAQERQAASPATLAVATTQHSYSKDKSSLQGVAKTEEGVTQEETNRIVMHTAAAGPCDPKSETEDVSSVIFSASVIFPSSRCGEAASPSLQGSSASSNGSGRTSQEAQEGFNASHLGSSSSNSLQCAQSHSMPLDTQANSDPNTVNTATISQVQILMTPVISASLEATAPIVSIKEGQESQTLSLQNTTTNIKNYNTSDGPLGDQGAFKTSQDKFSLYNKLNIPEKDQWWSGPASNAGWGIPRGLGLRGGGESSLNTGTANWGASPSASGSSNNSGGGWGQNTTTQNTNPSQAQWGGAPRPGSNNQGPNGQPNPVKGNQSPQQQGQSQATSAAGGQQGGGNQQPPSQASNQQNSQAGNGNNSGQQAPSQNGSPSWAQAAGGAGGGGPGKGPGQPPGGNGGGTSSSKQLEQLNSMREALFSQDGWGGQHVNQDTGWDIPTSPEPGNKDSSGGNTGGGPVWKPNVNNGTDLWEANLRNGGQPPPTTSKTPWGHTPATNIGGTWGEDDDVGDSSNVWHGVPSNNNPPGPQWGAGGPAPVPKKENEWGGGGGGGGGNSNWGEHPRDMRGNMMDPRSNERDMRGMGMDMRGGGNDMMRPDMMMRGDPRGPGGGPDPRMGRMNGETPMWGGPKNQQPPGNQWAGPPPKDMKSSSGWEEPSPPAQRRQIPNYDDGTSLWGNPGQQQASTWRGNKHDGSKVSHWKEIPTPNMGGRGGAGGMQCPPGMPQGRMPGSTGMKPDGSGPLWGHPQRNGSWADGPGGPHDGPGAWTDEGPNKMGGGWNDQVMLSGGNQGSWGGPKPKNPMGQGSWGDGAEVDPSSWGHPKPGPKPLTKELVWASKQFRILSEMGFKKEDVENALRSSNMNLEDALECLHSLNPGIRSGGGGGGNNDGWRRHEEHSPFDMGGSGGPHPGGPGSGGYGPGRGYNPGQQMPFAPPGPGVNNAPSLMNNANNPSLASINTMSPAIVQKILTQQPPPAAQQSAQQSFQAQQVPRTPQSQPQPSAAQLRMLVQQIQMAVQAGYLNHQILNQPLAPQTLLLLNQLLQQIKMLQNLLQQQAVAQMQSLGKGQSNTVLQMSVQITKTKQQITNLQNQIAAQQAIYVKQQHQQHIAAQGPQTGDFFKPPIPDAMAALHGNFGELSIKEPQSRLNQWKLPSLDKDGDGPVLNEFDRAPGTTTKSQSHTSPNMNPLLAQGDRYAAPLSQGMQNTEPWAVHSTWSSVGRGGGDSGWPDTTTSGDGSSQADGKEWPNSAAQASAAFTDLVPEFEPGKPWKGTQMKSIEDDPSITPGSVVRSPLSLATIKDTEIFSSSNKTSPPASVVASAADNAPIPSLSLSSSTWTFNPPSSTTSAFASLATNGSSSGGRGGGPSNANSSWGGIPPGGGWGSTWLLLRNLTPQIDGSTLKTLCVQHGPLQSFHLYLNHGIALAKYQSREEAGKAQGALNNCVLGNTTIFAESPAEAEVHSLLTHLHTTQPQTQVGSGWGNIRNSGPNSSGGQNAPPQSQSQQGPTKPPPDAWGGGSTGGGGSQLWPSPSASSLWGAPPMDDQHRATPSSLNSFLPGDLLGEGSM